MWTKRWMGLMSWVVIGCVIESAPSATTPWSDSRSVGFVYTERPAPTATPCTASGVSFSYTHFSRTLARDVCASGAMTTRSAVLDVSQQERLFDALQSLRTATSQRACDDATGSAPLLTISYTDGTQRGFTAFPSVCPRPAAEMIQAADLMVLSSTLQRLIPG